MTSVAHSSPRVCRAARDVNGFNLAPGASRAGGSFDRDKKHWTEEELRSLRRGLDDASLSNREIARLLRRSAGSVAHKISALGWARERPWTPEDDAELARLRATGMPNRDIAAALNRTPRAVSFRLYQKNTATRQKRLPWLASEVTELARMLGAGITEEEAAKHFGRTRKAIELKAWMLRRAGRVHKPDAGVNAHIATLIARGISPETANMLRRTK